MKVPSPENVLEVRHLVVAYGAGRGRMMEAVAGVSLGIDRGETLGLVGESGCGKSSLARAVMQCPRPTAGSVLLCGEALGKADRRRLRILRPRFQMLFQDSIAALNPRRSVGETIGMPLRLAGVGRSAARRQRVEAMMAAVGLDPATYGQRPFQFSGGQCQRVQIARALVTAPCLLVCDEPVSGLDVSIQAQIINLLEDMRQRFGLALLFISHDLAVVKNVCDRVAVMYMGKLCEVAASEDLYACPAHPYSRALLSAIPGGPRSLSRTGPGRPRADPPSPLDPPSGCRYRTRCPLAQERCAIEAPVLRNVRGRQWVACHFA